MYDLVLVPASQFANSLLNACSLQLGKPLVRRKFAGLIFFVNRCHNASPAGIPLLDKGHIQVVGSKFQRKRPLQAPNPFDSCLSAHKEDVGRPSEPRPCDR